ncbi:signal peptidase I [Oscillatoria sp. FACHB-1407]|nr:signal peptidase I [Oscillatoria sp. FACHB-1407]
MALSIHTFVAELRYNPFGTMERTLKVGDLPTGTLRDRLLVEKLSYRFRPPQRNDLVVFKAPPALQVQNLHDDMIKRVVGLPGDVVQVRNGQILINGKVIVEPYVKEKPAYNCGPITVPQHQYFVLGDNRNRSYDSHLWELVPEQNIIGHAILRIYSFGYFDLEY